MWYFAKHCDSDIQLDGKTVLITGGNSGIGKETTKELYKRGARIVILCRNEQKAKQAIKEIKNEVPQNGDKHHDIIFKKLDLLDFSSVRSCANDILKTEDKINILINNAGVICEETENKDYDVHFKVNYLGHVLLTLLLLPAMVKTGNARIINASSNSQNCPLYGGALHLNYFHENKKGMGWIETYCESKTAVVLFTKELARRLKDAGEKSVTVLSYHPGYANSPIWKNLNNLLWGLKFLYFLFVSWWLLTPEQAAQTVVFCAVDTKLLNHSGGYCSKCKHNPTAANKFTYNEKAAKQLWEKSLQLLKMEDYDVSSAIKNPANL